MLAVLTFAWYLLMYLVDILPPLCFFYQCSQTSQGIHLGKLAKTLKHNEVYTQFAMPQGASVKGYSLATPRPKYLLTLVTGVCVPEHPVHQKLPTLPIQDLCEQVSQVYLCWDVGNEGITHINGLTYCMVADQV